ncbi:MAG: serine/threonine protein kinase [Vulcanimicrobiota bacterium]
MRKSDSHKSSHNNRESFHRQAPGSGESIAEAHRADASRTAGAELSSSGCPDSGASKLTEYFYELTPERILEAFTQAGINCQPAVRFLNSLENRVASVEDEEGERWVAKFYRPGRHSREALLEEHSFLKELWDEDLPVIPPLELQPGGTGTLGSIAGIYFAVFPHRQGRPPDELDTGNAAILGELIARIHTVGFRRSSPHRQVWKHDTLGKADLAVLACVMPPDIWSRYERSAQRLIARISPRLANTPQGRIHGDFHRGNLLWSSSGPLIVDFDDTTMGPPVQDFWMMVPGRDAEALALREVMVHAYEKHRPFDRQSLELVEPLRAFRYIHYAAWLAARQHDPAFVRVLHDFGSRSYWRDELTELESQIELFM